MDGGSLLGYVRGKEEGLRDQLDPYGKECTQWRVIDEMEGMIISAKELPYKAHLFATKIEGNMKGRPVEVLRRIEGGEGWGGGVGIEERKYEEVGEVNIRVQYVTYQPKQLFIQKRDFYLLTSTSTSPKQSIITMNSIQDPAYPTQKGYMRGAIYSSGWVIEPFSRESDESHCSFILCIDLKGWMPYWWVNETRTSLAMQHFQRIQQTFA